MPTEDPRLQAASPSDLRLLAAVLGPDLETCPTDTSEVGVDLGPADWERLRRLDAGRGQYEQLLAFAINFAARVIALEDWRRATELSVHEQHQLLEAAFDAVFSGEAKGRFESFHLGREERSERWAAHARVGTLVQAWDSLIPEMERFNERAAARLARLQELERSR